MKLLYLDCFAGISGDMFLGALIDLGVSFDLVRNELAKLGLRGVQISTRQVVKQNIAATKFDCIEDEPLVTTGRLHAHRGYTEIVALIDKSDLSSAVKQRAKNIFLRIGQAEAHIHGIDLEKIHFHEVGAIDSIVDIVGSCVAMESLGIVSVQASPPRLGSGFVDTAHGRFPIPAPATLELLRGLPTQASTEPFELVTPTGAALLAEFCTAFGPMPPMTIEKIGYGAGTRDLDQTPNVLRAVQGELAAEQTGSSRPATETIDTIAVIETNIDDMNPQLFGDAMDKLLAAGALDVFLTPIQMKKNRPATMLTVLCQPTDVERLAELVLTHTTSFGVRLYHAERRKLAREIINVPTAYGTIQVKIGRLAGNIVARSPEFESCKEAAARANVTIKEVHAEAARAAKEVV